MKKTIITIGVGVVLILTSIIIDHYSNKFISKEEYEKIKSLYENSEKTYADLQNEYTEYTTTISKIKVKMYEFSYQFEVNNNKYTTKLSTSDTTQLKKIVYVWYSKIDPNNNSTSDPKDNFGSIKDKKIGNNTTYNVLMFIFLLLGIGIIIGGLKMLIINLIKGLARGRKKTL